MANLQDFYNTNDDNKNTVFGSIWEAQTFIAGDNYTIGSVKLKLYKTGGNHIATVSIKATLSSKPSGVDLCSGTRNSEDFTTNTAGEWYEFDFGAGTALTSGVEYAIVLKLPTGSSSNTVRWRRDTANGYASGQRCSSANSGGSWTAQPTDDFMFEIYDDAGSSPVDKTYSKKLVAFGNDEVWYESSAGTMAELSAANGNIATVDPLQAFELYQKVFIANKSKLRVADFGNVKITTTSLGANPPDYRTVLTGGTSGAKMVVDYITSLSGACTIYGKRITAATFEAETVTGTDDDGNAISFTGTAEASGPHWYNWTPFGNSTANYGELPDLATLGCNYRGRVVLSGNSSYPHQWYMSRQGNPWDYVYGANDAQSPTKGGNSDCGEIGDIVVALMPYKDDFLVFGCATTMWYLAGDPMEGGSINELDLTTGMFGSKSYCWDGEGNLYFWGTNGIYKTTVPGTPMCISEIRLPDLVDDEAVNPSTHRITMAYDVKRGGILICITTLATGANSNYWYNLKTGGFFPESYADECGAFSLFYYPATNNTYRILLMGCNDGYVRFFDNSAKDDDIGGTDQAIDSYVKFGPIPMSQDPGKTGNITGLDLITAGGGVSGSQSDSDDVSFKVFTANSAEKIIEKLSANTNPQYAGTFAAPGRRLGSRRKQKVKGTYLGIRLDNTASGETWGFEKLFGKIVPSGKVR